MVILYFFLVSIFLIYFVRMIISTIDGKLFVDEKEQTSWNGNTSIKTNYRGNKQVNIQIGNFSVITSDPIVNINIEGNAESVSNVAGDVKVSGNVLKNVQTTSGDINCENCDGSVSSISGDITINGNVSGDVKTTSGDIEIETCEGNVSSMSGDIDISTKKEVVNKTYKQTPKDLRNKEELESLKKSYQDLHLQLKNAQEELKKKNADIEKLISDIAKVETDNDILRKSDRAYREMCEQLQKEKENNIA